MAGNCVETSVVHVGQHLGGGLINRSSVDARDLDGKRFFATWNEVVPEGDEIDVQHLVVPGNGDVPGGLQVLVIPDRADTDGQSRARGFGHRDFDELGTWPGSFELRQEALMAGEDLEVKFLVRKPRMQQQAKDRPKGGGGRRPGPARSSPRRPRTRS